MEPINPFSVMAVLAVGFALAVGIGGWSNYTLRQDRFVLQAQLSDALRLAKPQVYCPSGEWFSGADGRK